jgi:cell division protein YceG involved in septum cleavage
MGKAEHLDKGAKSKNYFQITRGEKCGLVVDKQAEKTTTVMPESACGHCEFYGQCPVEKRNGQYRLEHTAKQRRLAARRREQATEVFRQRYKIRDGPAVFHAILLKVAGWNMLRAEACTKMQKIVYERGLSGYIRPDSYDFEVSNDDPTCLYGLQNRNDSVLVAI